MRTDDPRLDAATAPLDGVLSVEASAGTGKTHAIEQLYVRLVLERDLDVPSILVVTYTKAATAELKTRIRNRLETTVRTLAAGTTADPFDRALLERLPDRAAATETLVRALRAFDEAAIFTIHGFCERVLEERAFESGVAFEAELVPDQSDLLLEVVDDFWRRATFDAPPHLLRALLDDRWSPEKLRDDLRRQLGRSFGRVEAVAMPDDLDARGRAYDAALAAVRDAWPGARGPVAALLARPGLNQGAYGPRQVGRILATLDLLVATAEPDATMLEAVEKLTATQLAARTNRGGKTPEHPFFGLAGVLVRAKSALDAGLAAAITALRAQLLAEAAIELARRKAERGVRSYEDLLSAVARALEDPMRGPGLASAIRARWRAALIDEFQDTDPEQYRIVRRIYGAGDLPVVLVGDPKQAIYSFRGADVFSYLAARREARRRARLDMNHRADPPLVHAVNALFGGRARPFVLDGIEFTATEPARDPAVVRLAVEGDDPAALRMWWMTKGGAPAERLGSTEARTAVARATAIEIVRLLRLARAGEATCEGEPLRGSDIAVLVRRNAEGRLMRETLLERGVPSVQQAIDSIFASREAEELERVLLAVLEPARATLVRAALATEMLGGTSTELERLERDEGAWDERIEAFHEYHQRWRRDGFSGMLQAILRREGVAARLLAFPDGERRLTNLFHLRELLQAAAGRQGGGLDALVEWLANERQGVGDPDVGEDEHLLRLESDAELVKIVTVHKAKGLQYPIVFCPFLWDGALFAERASSIVYHEDDVATLELDPPKGGLGRSRAAAEELAERLRLLYVALTRAKHRCYLAWGAVRRGGTSPLGWLLHGAGATTLEAVASRYDGASPAELRAEVDALAARAEGTILVEPLPDADPGRLEPLGFDPSALAPCRLGRRVGEGFTIASFSGLVRRAGELERADYDQTKPGGRGQAGAVGRDRHGFPTGTRAGRCLHRILERLDFVTPDLSETGTTLRQFGIEDVWADVVGAWMGDVLGTPLDQSGLRLGALPRARRRDELEFYFPVGRLDVQALGRRLADAGFAGGAFTEASERLRGDAVAGFCRGAIDCVVLHEGRFFVIDYKSNRLGTDVEAYAAPALVAPMARGHYWLQYLLYTLAVHRWLARRLPDYDYDAHFGGIRYLFLRGMDPSRGAGHGVWADRPSRTVIELLDACVRGDVS